MRALQAHAHRVLAASRAQRVATVARLVQTRPAPDLRQTQTSRFSFGAAQSKPQAMQSQPDGVHAQPSGPQATQQPKGAVASFKSFALLCLPACLAVLAGRGGALDFWHWYLQMLQEHPFTSRIATGMVGMFVGDLLAQVFPPLVARLRKSPNPPPFTYDGLRASRLVMYSAVVGTPVAYYWYNMLDAVVSPSQPTALATVATKVALDQLLLTPIMTAAFFAAMCMLEGRAHAAYDAVRTKLVPTLKANYMLWPAAHCINFAFVPGDQRILYINCVAVLWTVVLSTAAAAPVKASASTRAGDDDLPAPGNRDITFIAAPKPLPVPISGRKSLQ